MMQIVRVAILAQLLFATGAAGAGSSLKAMRLRTLMAANLPDPKCHTGQLSLPGGEPDPQVCCAGYCGECSDYPTCKSVRGQDSENACCASKVAEMSCAAGAPANVCLKSCEEAVPPCIMPGNDFKMPEGETAAKDCNEAIPDWMNRAKEAVQGAAKDTEKTGGPSGEDQWKLMQKRNFMPS